MPPNNNRESSSSEMQEQHQRALTPLPAQSLHQQEALHESSPSLVAESSLVGPRLAALNELNRVLEEFDPARNFDDATSEEKLIIHEARFFRLFGEGAVLIRKIFADIERDSRAKGWSKTAITNVTACAMRLRSQDIRNQASKSQNSAFIIPNRMFANRMPYAGLEGNSTNASLLETIKKGAREEQLLWIISQYDRFMQVSHPPLSGPSDGTYSQHDRLDQSSIPLAQQSDDPDFQPGMPARVWTLPPDIHSPHTVGTEVCHETSCDQRRRITAPAPHQQSGNHRQDDTQPGMENPQRPPSVIPDQSGTTSLERTSVDDDSRRLRENGGSTAKTKRRQREGKRPANWRGGSQGGSGGSLRKIMDPFKFLCKCLCRPFTSFSGEQRKVRGGKLTQI